VLIQGIYIADNSLELVYRAVLLMLSISGLSSTQFVKTSV